MLCNDITDNAVKRNCVDLRPLPESIRSPEIADGPEKVNPMPPIKPVTDNELPHHAVILQYQMTTLLGL